jgi:hypothetical protein
MAVGATPIGTAGAPEWIKVGPGRYRWTLGDEITYDGDQIGLRPVKRNMSNFLDVHFLNQPAPV